MASIIPLPILRFRTHSCGVRQRPCPFKVCRYHLERDESIQARGNTGERHEAQLAARDTSETCALDVADRGEHSAVRVASLLGITKQRVQQIEKTAVGKLASKRVEWFGGDE
jgi:hypothetical protein